MNGDPNVRNPPPAISEPHVNANMGVSEAPLYANGYLDNRPAPMANSPTLPSIIVPQPTSMGHSGQPVWLSNFTSGQSWVGGYQGN